MPKDSSEATPQIAWKFSRARDVLTLWDERDESPQKIEVSGVMVRQLTGGADFEDLPAHTRSYVLNVLFARPDAYGAKVIGRG